MAVDHIPLKVRDLGNGFQEWTAFKPRSREWIMTSNPSPRSWHCDSFRDRYGPLGYYEPWYIYGNWEIDMEKEAREILLSKNWQWTAKMDTRCDGAKQETTMGPLETEYWETPLTASARMELGHDMAKLADNQRTTLAELNKRYEMILAVECDAIGELTTELTQAKKKAKHLQYGQDEAARERSALQIKLENTQAVARVQASTIKAMKEAKPSPMLLDGASIEQWQKRADNAKEAWEHISAAYDKLKANPVVIEAKPVLLDGLTIQDWKNRTGLARETLQRAQDSRDAYQTKLDCARRDLKIARDYARRAEELRTEGALENSRLRERLAYIKAAANKK